ncbi:MAG: hypothetical protein V8S72_01165 [Oscillospiraceae bacterium]
MKMTFIPRSESPCTASSKAIVSRPAGYRGERGAQLARHLGDELRARFLPHGDLFRHAVQLVGKAAKLVFAGLFNFDSVAAGGDVARGLSEIPIGSDTKCDNQRFTPTRKMHIRMMMIIAGVYIARVIYHTASSSRTIAAMLEANSRVFRSLNIHKPSVLQ